MASDDRFVFAGISRVKEIGLIALRKIYIHMVGNFD